MYHWLRTGIVEAHQRLLLSYCSADVPVPRLFSDGDMKVPLYTGGPSDVIDDGYRDEWCCSVAGDIDEECDTSLLLALLCDLDEELCIRGEASSSGLERSSS